MAEKIEVEVLIELEAKMKKVLPLVMVEIVEMEVMIYKQVYWHKNKAQLHIYGRVYRH